MMPTPLRVLLSATCCAAWLSACGGSSSEVTLRPTALTLPSGAAVAPHFQPLFTLGKAWSYVADSGEVVTCRVDAARSFEAGLASRIACDGENGGVDGVWAVTEAGLWRSPPGVPLEGNSLEDLTRHPMLLPQQLEPAELETDYGCQASIFEDARGWCIEERCSGAMDFSYCFDAEGISFITDSATSTALIRRDAAQ